jgi:AIPR protein
MKMIIPSKSLRLSVRDNDHCKRLADPISQSIFHLEALLPFSEANKLEPGNANVRPPSEIKRPFREMIETVAESPETFHLKNRGITYLCDRFEFDNSKRTLTVHVPNIEAEQYGDDGVPKFGIADGGHTFRVINNAMQMIDVLRQDPEWVEPFVRVHFLSGEGSQEASIEGIVEALNTSSQVQQYTLDEYKNEFDELKEALEKAGFDVGLVAFRENEDKEWHVIEIIQRLACFLKDRWQETHPASMYKSKTKALELFTNKSTRGEFSKLFDVIKDVVTLPEYIQSQLSLGGLVETRSFGRLRSVKAQKKPFVRPGTLYQSRHKLDGAALLPMASAFRELLQAKGDRYYWRVPPTEAFPRCAESLYKALLNRGGRLRITSHLGTDMEYWGACAQIVMRTQTSIIEERMQARDARASQ